MQKKACSRYIGTYNNDNNILGSLNVSIVYISPPPDVSISSMSPTNNRDKVNSKRKKPQVHFHSNCVNQLIVQSLKDAYLNGCARAQHTSTSILMIIKLYMHNDLITPHHTTPRRDHLSFSFVCCIVQSIAGFVVYTVEVNACVHRRTNLVFGFMISLNCCSFIQIDDELVNGRRCYHRRMHN